MPSPAGHWILPFKGRNRSLSLGQNFLWRQGPVYVMDNHRAALWCWMQHISGTSRHGLFHIDAHYDARNVSEDALSCVPDLAAIGFQDYLDFVNPDSHPVTPLFCWDNYLYVFQRRYFQHLGDYFVATHGYGSPPPDSLAWEEINIARLPGFYREALSDYGHDGWILNIDLDYFFSRQPDGLKTLQSDSYISEIFSATATALAEGRVTCLTICLSPECCGGWDASERLCARLSTALGLGFSLA